MSIKDSLKNNDLTLEDLQEWNKDFTEVEKIMEDLKPQTLQDVLDRFHRIGVDVTSDTHEPLEYVDFNYGSLCCTISIYRDDKTPELLKDGNEGYIRRNGEELAGFWTVDIDEVREILNV